MSPRSGYGADVFGASEVPSRIASGLLPRLELGHVKRCIQRYFRFPTDPEVGGPRVQWGRGLWKELVCV